MRTPTHLTVALVALMFAGCDGGDDAAEPAQRPEAAASVTTPTPGADGAFPTQDVFPLEAGMAYTTAAFRPRLEITAGTGWTAETADRADHVSVARDVTRGQAILAFHHFTKVFDPRRGGEKPGDMVDGPRDVVTWLRDHPHLRIIGDPRPVSVLGLEGTSLDVTAQSSPRTVPGDCGKSGDEACVPLFHDGFDFAFLGSDGRSRFMVLGEPGEQLVVEQYVDPKERFASLIEVLDAQLGRVRVLPGG